jgi:hypothetical protein
MPRPSHHPDMFSLKHATRLWAVVDIDPCYFQHEGALPFQLNNKSYYWFKRIQCSPLTFVLTVCNGRWVIVDNNYQLYTIGISGEMEWVNITYSTHLCQSLVQ